MNIVSIFADKLFSFHYDNETENELKRLLSLWNDVSYLHQFLKENAQDSGSIPIEELLHRIIADANYIDDLLYSLSKNQNEKLESFFKPLHNSEYQFQLLSLQKGRKNYLRIYAIKIEENCFVITGGAIKLTQSMRERNHTEKELDKLEKAKEFLKSNGVFDSDSFYEFLMDTPL